MISLKSPREIEMIRTAGKILAGTLVRLKREAKEGITLDYLDNLAFKLIKQAGARPAFLGYKPDGAKKPYKASICASVNNVVVHGFPNNYKLKQGDILKIDLGVEQKNFYADAAETIIIGKGIKLTEDLISATRKALYAGIKYAKPGNYLGDIGWVIEKTAKKFNFSVIKGLTGHGIGYKLHEEPTIYNFGRKGSGLKLKPGMILAIEPMFSVGSDEIIQKSDESWATIDGSLSAHFEHTIAVTEKGPMILTE